MVNYVNVGMILNSWMFCEGFGLTMSAYTHFQLHLPICFSLILYEFITCQFISLDKKGQVTLNTLITNLGN